MGGRMRRSRSKLMVFGVKGLALAALWGCSGPKLKPTVTDTNTTEEETFDPVLPPGGSCAPERVSVQAAIPVSEQPQPAVQCPEPAPAPGTEGYSPVRPLGIGYPGVINT